MSKATLQVETKLWKKGFKKIICVDEVGRGALAGPVVASAVFLNLKFKAQILKLKNEIKNLRDSKKLTPRKRKEFYEILTKNPNINWSVAKVYPKVIDRINILEATKLAMKRAVENLNYKLHTTSFKKTNSHFPQNSYNHNFLTKINFLILDGKIKLDLPIPQKAIVRADEKVFSCAIASIIAKVIRDNLMLKYDKVYPQYSFDLHKGYGTKLHLTMLKKLGPCKIHRRSFRPVDKFT
jgi:ribonuclease HII